MADLVHRLDQFGYRGDYSFEVFNDDYQQIHLPTVCQRAYNSAAWVSQNILRKGGAAACLDDCPSARTLCQREYLMIGANTALIAHIGFPTHSFKSPMIYNPYFEAAGVSALSLYDARSESADALMQRVNKHYPHIAISTGSNDPAEHDLVVNATPMGMEPGDPLPLDVSRLSSDTFVGEVVMRQAMTAILQAAAERGCRYQIGTDMLVEMIAAYLRSKEGTAYQWLGCNQTSAAWPGNSLP